MEYLTVGTNNITYEQFKEIEDTKTDIMKPNGGIWLTEYNPLYKNYNLWVDFILDNPNLLFYKNRSSNIWQQPCSIVTLKSDTNIFNLDDYDSWKYLHDKFPLNSQKFSYEKMTKIYDGIYVDVTKLFKRNLDDNLFKFIRQYGVSSLLLFNLDCIDYYQSGSVNIEPFDFEYQAYDVISYEISYDDIKKRILKK